MAGLDPAVCGCRHQLGAARLPFAEQIQIAVPGLITAAGVPLGKAQPAAEVSGSSRHIDAAARQDRPTTIQALQTKAHGKPGGQSVPSKACVLPDFRQGPLDAKKLQFGDLPILFGCRQRRQFRAASSHSEDTSKQATAHREPPEAWQPKSEGLACEAAQTCFTCDPSLRGLTSSPCLWL